MAETNPNNHTRYRDKRKDGQVCGNGLVQTVLSICPVPGRASFARRELYHIRHKSKNQAYGTVRQKDVLRRGLPVREIAPRAGNGVLGQGGYGRWEKRSTDPRCAGLREKERMIG